MIVVYLVNPHQEKTEKTFEGKGFLPWMVDVHSSGTIPKKFTCLSSSGVGENSVAF